MMTPEELQVIGETLYPYIEKLNQWIVNRIVEAIMTRIGRGEAKMLSASDIWRYQVYQDTGGNDEELLQQIASFTKSLESEVKQIFEDAGITAFNADSKAIAAAGKTPIEKMSPRMVEIMTDAYKRTMGECRNFTRTTATQTQTQLISALDSAYWKVQSGADSYTSAVKSAVLEVSDLQARVRYPSGHVDTLEVAILRAVRTGTAQATGNMTLQRTLEEGWNHVRISEHLGARVHETNPIANHAGWQGKVYQIEGESEDYPNLEKSTGYPNDPLGLEGYNCRHSFGPFLPGVSILPESRIDSEENKQRCEDERKMRSLERAIRESKTRLLALQKGIDTATDTDAQAALQAEYDRSALKLQRQNAAYDKFCKDNGLKKLPDRISIAKWGRSEAAKATAAANRAK